MSKIRNQIAPIFIFLTIAGYLVLVITSCNNDDKGIKTKQVTIDIPKDYSGLDSIDHYISDKQIAEYKTAFKMQRDTVGKIYPYLFLPESEAFNKRSLLSLLQLPDCVGLKIYHGVKRGKKDQLRIIIVGVNSKGEDILIGKGSIIATKLLQEQGGLESGQCPPCATFD